MVNRDTAGLETSCEKCDPGFYNDIPGNETCKYCPIGYSQNEKGLSYCIGCIPGQYQHEQGGQKCAKCSSGRKFHRTSNSSIQVGISALNCAAFDKGQYQREE